MMLQRPVETARIIGKVGFAAGSVAKALKTPF
jgi:hypothetical protein